jgi:hypothetical protein
MSRTRIAALSVVLALAAPAGASTAAASPAGCAEGSAEDAARSLVHPLAQLVEVDQVAGFHSAVVLEPVMDPGIRHRLIRAGGRWCTTSAFNEAWRLAGRPADAVRMARAFAQLGAVAYFDDVTVLRSTMVAPGVVTVQTHAHTNGIRALWTVQVDAQGVQQARWTATRFAVAPFEAHPTGLTALPGAERTYLRSPAGMLAQQEPLLPAVNPEVVTEGTTVDDFLIRVSTSESEVSPNIGQDTGVTDLDYIRIMRDVALENYNAFHEWGFRKNWASDIGMIWVDNSTGATCLACVVRSTTFNIHMSSQVLRALFALGWEYPDDRKALSTVIGHEMWHNWQNAYGQPNFQHRMAAFSEGTARMSETAHDYSDVSHQPLSLTYHTGRELPFVSLAANSCNGWAGADVDATFAAGPFTGKTYNACYFYLTWYHTHGPEGMVALLDAFSEAALEQGHWNENRLGIEMATGEPILNDLVIFARASLSGHGYTWAAGDGTGPERDWGLHLNRWEPPALAAGDTAAAALRDGGMIARQIDAGGFATLQASLPEAALAVVRSNPDEAHHEVIASETCIDPPAAGEDVWLVGVYPETGTASVTIGLDPLPAGAEACQA